MVYVLAAIMWLVPQLGHIKAAEYAKLITFEARWYRVDPFDVVAIIQIESRWSTKKKSVTNDYGLMQVHVARRGSSRFLGRTKELFDPATNIREGVRIYTMWLNYHEKWCKPDSHDPIAHYKWGKYVKNDEHARRVRSLSSFLARKFRPKKPAVVAHGIVLR